MSHSCFAQNNRIDISQPNLPRKLIGSQMEKKNKEETFEECRLFQIEFTWFI